MRNITKVVYSEEELATTVNMARKDAAYFRGLDWENEFGKWGHVATPWRDHYPNCWRDLVKVSSCFEAVRKGKILAFEASEVCCMHTSAD